MLSALSNEPGLSSEIRTDENLLFSFFDSIFSLPINKNLVKFSSWFEMFSLRILNRLSFLKCSPAIAAVLVSFVSNISKTLPAVSKTGVIRNFESCKNLLHCCNACGCEIT